MIVWNDDTVDLLTRLTTEGKSAAEIAAYMGITRNMVVGKRWRMKMPSGMSRGLPKSEKRAKPALPAKVKRVAKVKREKRLARLAIKKPGRLCFNLGITGRIL
jgi:hypothetical protein